MRIVVTETGTALGHSLVKHLSHSHDVFEFNGDALDPAACAVALANADAVIDLRPVASMDTAPDPGSLENPQSWKAAGVHIEHLSRGTYVLMRAAVEAGASRYILGSTLRHLEGYVPTFSVAESWRPRPDVDDPAGLGAYLAEETARQLALVEPLAVICLRFATISTGHNPVTGDEVHVDDAVQACVRAIEAPLAISETYSRTTLASGWWVFHVPGGGDTSRFPVGAARGIGYAPAHDCEVASRTGVRAPRDTSTVPSRVIRRVTMFGAGGPLGAATAPHLMSAYTVRLTDARSLAEIRDANQPQSPGAPLPSVPQAPHESITCDVTDPVAVAAACEGADAIINLTVIRHDVPGSFRVNLEGAYYVMRAARAHGIRRSVHTGPALNLHDRPAGYGHEFGVPDDAPARTGVWQYTVAKYLGQEVVRLAADAFGLESPTLVFCAFVNPDVAEPAPGGPHPMSISWDDAGRALRHTVDAPGYPAPFELMHITADLPHDRYSNAKAKALLGWSPRDNLEHLYARHT